MAPGFWKKHVRHQLVHANFCINSWKNRIYLETFHRPFFTFHVQFIDKLPTGVVVFHVESVARTTCLFR